MNPSTKVNVQMGFNYATPTLPQGEVFLITEVMPGMPMNAGGLKQFDHIRFRDTGDLYRLILDNPGDTITIPIKRGDTISIPIEEGDVEMDLRVAVPPLRLTFPAKWYE